MSLGEKKMGLGEKKMGLGEKKMSLGKKKLVSGGGIIPDPKPPRGTQDILPPESYKFRKMMDIAVNVFQSFGYKEVFTPAFENLGLLSTKSGEDVKNEIYHFKDKSGRELGLRFDMTIPVARVVAGNPNMRLPIKFCYIAPQWRYERPQAGRFREHWQFGVELIGVNSAVADAEILSVVNALLRGFGIKKAKILVNSRELIEKVLEKMEISGDKNGVFRAIDKIDKIDVEGVREELKKQKLSEKQSTDLLKFIEKKGDPLKKATALLGTDSQELKNIVQIIDNAKKLGVDAKLDLSKIRGLDYYTGFVFETVVEGFENFGSVCSGGRYDELMGIVGKRDLPATGMGFGPSRLMEVMKEMNLPFGENTATQIFVASAGSDVTEKVSEIAFELRKFGLNVESELIGRKLSKQFEYCDSEGIPWVLIVGSRDFAEGKVTLREMGSGKEELLNLTNLKAVVEKINGGESNA